LRPAGTAGIVFKPPPADKAVRAESDLQALLDTAAQELPSRVDRRGDDLGFEWLIVRDFDLDQLTRTVYQVASQLVSRGLGDRLLAATFRFDGGKQPVYLIYGFDGSAFWPFAPTGEDRQRDNELELELKDKLEKELPIEQNLSRWLALFDAPL